jgi:hypothetical protein
MVECGTKGVAKKPLIILRAFQVSTLLHYHRKPPHQVPPSQLEGSFQLISIYAEQKKRKLSAIHLNRFPLTANFSVEPQLRAMDGHRTVNLSRPKAEMEGRRVVGQRVRGIYSWYMTVLFS